MREVRTHRVVGYVLGVGSLSPDGRATSPDSDHSTAPRAIKGAGDDSAVARTML